MNICSKIPNDHIKYVEDFFIHDITKSYTNNSASINSKAQYLPFTPKRKKKIITMVRILFMINAHKINEK